MTLDSPRQDKGILVRKYGGSSLASADRIKTVARDVRLARDEGYRLVVVVSAMGKTTDELAALSRSICEHPPRRELDMLLSVGERITMSLLSMALDAEGCPAISYTGSQCGIITDTSHNDARILEVRGDRVRDSLARGYTVVVAGFQGVSEEKEITTLGRGGSDTTAVALAAALGAVRCEILKDVDGVLTADPVRVPDARRHEVLTWEEMSKVAASGCGVVHIRAVEYAALHEVPLVVRSSFHDGPGTNIGTAASGAAETPAPGASTIVTKGREPSARTSRYRPLVMNVVENVTRLRLVTSDPLAADAWRDLALANLDPARTITEWLDTGAGFRWEVLAPGPALDRLRTVLPSGEETLATAVDWEDDLTCISLAGDRPDSWLEVQRHVAGLMDAAGNPGWRLRADGAAIRILVPGRASPDLLRHLHAALIQG